MCRCFLNKIYLLILFFFGSIKVFAGIEGYDYYKTSNYVEFDSNCFFENASLDMYDYSTGTYHSIDIEDVSCMSAGCEIEIYDYYFGEYRYIELEEKMSCN